MSYKHLSLEERYCIEIELKRDTSITAIAKALGRSQGSISKEIARNRGKRGYRHKQAHAFAQKRHLGKIKPHKLTPEVCQRIEYLLKEEQWSPEQIAGRLSKEENIHLHHETIYRYIYRDKADGGVHSTPTSDTLAKPIEKETASLVDISGSKRERTSMSVRLV